MDSRILVLRACPPQGEFLLTRGSIPGSLLSVWAATVKVVGRGARASDTQHVATATAGLLHHSLDTRLSDPLFLWFSFMLTVIPWGGTVTPGQGRKAWRDEATCLEPQVRVPLAPQPQSPHTCPLPVFSQSRAGGRGSLQASPMSDPPFPHSPDEGAVTPSKLCPCPTHLIPTLQIKVLLLVSLLSLSRV